MTSSTPTPPSTADAVAAAIDQGRLTRRTKARRRGRLALVLPATITVVWAIALTAFGLWPRIFDRWPATVTMVFGGFVAGSTPQGGGAVAFPVFTKVLHAPSEVARSMGLFIQVTGMGSAAVAIIVRRVPVAWRALGLVFVPAVVGMGLALVGASRLDKPFAPSVLDGPYVKVAFTILIVAMASTVFATSRRPLRERRANLGKLNARSTAVLVVAGLLGGFISGLTGSGADVAFFTVIVLLFGLDPRIGVPSSVILMAALSVLGLIALGGFDGQLRVRLDAERTSVVAVSGNDVGLVDGTLTDNPAAAASKPAPAQRFDLLGLWLAGVPAAAWAGPLGAALAARLKDKSLALLVAGLAFAEMASTAIFLDALRTDRALLAFFVIGTVVAVVGLSWASKNRQRLFKPEPWDPSKPVTRMSVIATGSFSGWGRALAAERGDSDLEEGNSDDR